MFWQWGRARRCPRSFPYPAVLYHVKPLSAASSLFLSSDRPFPVSQSSFQLQSIPPYPRSIHSLPPMFLSAPSQSPLLSQVNSFPVAYRASSHFDYKPLYIRIICFNAQISQKSRHKNRSVDIPPQKKLLVILTTSFIFVRIYVCRG